MTERRQADASREMRLEGFTLIMAGALLLALVVGAFLFGRWVERRAQPPAELARADADPLAQLVQVAEPEDVSGARNYFDDLEGQEKELEPDRQARPVGNSPAPVATRPVPADPQEAAGGSEPAAATPGPWWIQVFAGRDRASAEQLVGELIEADWPVKIFAEREGSGSLYRVRVGGFGSEDKARKAALSLQKDRYSVWVMKLD